MMGLTEEVRAGMDVDVYISSGCIDKKAVLLLHKGG
jgi:hypothetical protein